MVLPLKWYFLVFKYLNILKFFYILICYQELEFFRCDWSQMWNISKNVGRQPATTFEKTSMYIGADIALLELLEEVDLSVYTPVCLPSSVRNRDNTPALAIGKTFIRFSSLFGIVLNSTLWFMEFPLKPSLRIDRRSNLGWGLTGGWIKTLRRECRINSTGWDSRRSGRSCCGSAWLTDGPPAFLLAGCTHTNIVRGPRTSCSRSGSQWSLQTRKAFLRLTTEKTTMGFAK